MIREGHDRAGGSGSAVSPSVKGAPLEAIDRLARWESFRAGSAGRKPIDAIVLFRMRVLQALNNLSDEQVKYQVRDRLHATILAVPREACQGRAHRGAIRPLDQHLAAEGYMARGGHMVDATIVPVPMPRNSRRPVGYRRSGTTSQPNSPRRALDEEAWLEFPIRVRGAKKLSEVLKLYIPSGPLRLT